MVEGTERLVTTKRRNNQPRQLYWKSVEYVPFTKEIRCQKASTHGPLPKIPMKRKAWPSTWHRHWKTSCGRWKKELSCRSRWRSTKRIKRSAHMMNFLIKRKDADRRSAQDRHVHESHPQFWAMWSIVFGESMLFLFAMLDWWKRVVFVGLVWYLQRKRECQQKMTYCHCPASLWRNDRIVVHNNFKSFFEKTQKSWQLGGRKRRVDIRNVS